MKGIYELEMAKEIDEQPEGNNILIVDSLNLAFRYKHIKRTDFAQDYYKTVKSLAKSYAATNIILTCDWGKSSYRKALYPDYKADREAKVALQTEEEKQDFVDFFKGYEEAMDFCKDSFTILKYKGVEADDIAAYLTEYIYKDVEWHDTYEYPHEMALSIKVLVGGKDNVTGIPGVGAKRAHTLLKEYGDAFGVYDSIPLPGKAVYIKNTNEFKENILRNIELIDKMTYCTEAIGRDNVEDIKGIING